MNNCILVGRLTGDPEIRYANNEARTAVAKMSIAVDRPVRKGEEKKTDFFRCVCFGTRAEFAAKYLKKGKRVVMQGRMQNEEFTSKDGGQVRYTELLAREITFADGKDDSAGNAGGGNGEPVRASETSGVAGTAGKAQGTAGKGSADMAGRKKEAARTKKADERFLDMPDGEEELPFH